ncbi:hypothetical protein HN51_019594 [Arachis hypogaea]|uniref:uncharacterized protein n=1 Tax=Arachis hypogaea TaxID=3818 RepID=UPI000DECCAAE|nr:GATA zinc finger domain-containing protein 14 [Arachis hypogaea]QHO31383.1 uncharacterized protein DS421_8g241100 [Arachis hypogaea]
MASLVSKLSFFFFFFVLVLSPQIQAREGKVFSLFTHFRTIYNVKEHQNLPEKPKAKSPTPAPTLEPIAAPTPEPITAPAPAPAPESGSTTVESGPAPEPDFVDNGNGYGLYGTESSATQYSSPNKETPITTTTTFENELLDEDLIGESFNNNNNNNYNYNPNSYSNNVVKRNSNNYNNEEEFRNNYNNGYNKNHEDSYSNNNEEEFRSSYNNGYDNKNHEDSYSNNNYNERYTNNYNNGNEYSNNKNNYNERYTSNYNTNNEYNSNYNNVFDEVKREGMSDTRFMENGKYYYPVKNNNNQNYNLNEYESVRGKTENEGYYEKTQYPNEFDTMEEYEKQQESQGYTP